MIQLVIFLLATTGLTFITNKSNIMKPLRVFIAQKYVSHRNLFTSWMNGIFECGMCMSVYTGTICAVVMYYGYTMFLFPFCATTIITLVFQYYDKVNRA